MFLLDKWGRVLHRNHAAELLLQQGDSLLLQNQMLVPAAPHMRQPFRTFLKSICFSREKVPIRPMSLAKTTSGRPLQILAAPVQSEADKRYLLLLVINDPDASTSRSIIALREYFGFTSAEAEVANGILAGYSIGEIAEARSVSIGTVRIQMKSIFAKAGVNRQADLVKLLLMVPTIALW